MKRILCYGDSNMWGHVPAKGTRYPEDVRWPSVMAGLLGPDYMVIEDSISGRTTVWEDPKCPSRCGRDNLGYALLAHAPIDLVVFALGTNDLKFTDPAGVARGMAEIIDRTRDSDRLYGSFSPIFRDEKRILLLAPPYIDPSIEQKRPQHALAHAAAASRELAPLYARLAEEKQTAFLDLAPLAQASPEDCIHMKPEGHRAVAQAVADKVRQILG
jgi:lysophospholipase L1-like esterase